MAVLTGCGPAGTVPSDHEVGADATQWLSAHAPELADWIVRADADGWERGPDGFRARLQSRVARTSRGSFRSTERPLLVLAPHHANGSIVLDTALAAEIRISRRGGRPVPCEPEGALLVCRASGPGLDHVTLVEGGVLEELVVVHGPDAAVGYDVTLPRGWSLAPVAGLGMLAEIRDARGAAQVRVAASVGWDSTGARIPLRLAVDAVGFTIVFAADQRWPIVIDPSFVDASVPARLRGEHSATLLLDGRVLIAGGVTTEGVDDTAELYDPRTGTSRMVGLLTNARSGHTATLLRDGRVLLTGGLAAATPLASTELFDPETESFSAGPAMSAPRTGHTATRLRSGELLLVGGGSAAPELFDPTTDALVTTGSMAQPMAPGSAAALLPDGRVLLVGLAQGLGLPTAAIFDREANAGAGAFVTTGAPTSFEPLGHSLTTLRDGRVLVLGGCPCLSLGGAIESSRAAELFDPAANGGSGAFVPSTSNAVRHRMDHSATLLPSGQVLIAGSSDEAPSPEQSTAEIYDPTSDTFTELSGAMAAPHGTHTATLLPSGNVLLFGGDQAAAELFVGGGAVGPGAFVTTATLATARYQHSATTLPDGSVLVVGGGAGGTFDLDLATAERFDEAAGTFTATGPLQRARRMHSATALPDGRVLVAGGLSLAMPVAQAERYDPTANGGIGAFAQAGEMTTPRYHHSATLLPDGRLLIAGGIGSSGILASAELYDPTTGTFAATSSALVHPRSGHGAALLPTGKILIVGDTTAELYDPATDTFAPTAAPGTGYANASVVVLPSGKALVTGSSTLAAELYDPTSETFSFTGADEIPRGLHQAIALPTGSVLIAGGQGWGVEPPVYAHGAIFEPLSERFVPTPPMTSARTAAAAALLPSGAVLVTGGLPQLVAAAPAPLASAELWSPSTGDATWRPTITAAPTAATPGETIELGGTGFGGPEAGGGRSNASASNHPVAIWQAGDTAAVEHGRILDWTDSSARWQVPPSFAHGAGWLTIVVNGIASRAVPLRIDGALLGHDCQQNPQCASGYCVDGVCCDSPCDALCQACRADLKGDGADGTCGTVPPELDLDDDCVLSRGSPCTDGAQCITAHCVDGVCCEGTCEQQCEACDLSGSIGLCVPVVGLPHGERPTCDVAPPDDPCETHMCDGLERAECADTVGPCAPYACTSTGCVQQCTDLSHCAVGYHCEDGACIGGRCEGTIVTTPEGVVVDCSPYRCRADGTCLPGCTDVHDCVEPYACNFDGRCVPRPTNDDYGSGCGCRLAGGRVDASNRAGWWLGLLAVGLTVRGRRRRLWARWPAILGMATLLAPGVARAQPERPSPLPAPTAAPAPASAPTAAPASPAAPPMPPELTLDPSSDSDGVAPADGVPPVANAPPEIDLQQRKRGARERFQRGLALSRENAWSAALAEFRASLDVFPTRVAAKNAAICLRTLARFDEALDAYEELLRAYPEQPAADRTAFAHAVTELRDRVGTIEVDAAEPGATILIDGQPRGTYPALRPLRVATGTHVVRVSHEGFEPFETQVEVAGGRSIRVAARLSALASSGTLKVTEVKGTAMDVLVDNVLVGRTPWEGRLSVGHHAVRLRGRDKLGTVPVPAPVRSGETTQLQLRAMLLDATLRVEPTPASALIAIDSVIVGRGVWEGRLPSGAHRIEVTDEGFHPVQRTVQLTADAPEDFRVALERDDDAEIWQLPSKFTLDLTGALALAPSFGGDVTGGCEDNCSQGVGLGGLAFLHLGYELGSGLGFGLSAGYLEAGQSIEGRSTLVHPVGLASRAGAATDELRLRGLAVGATASWLLGEDYPVLLRLGAGPLFATVRDRRIGTFASDGLAYQVGPRSQEPAATYLYADPEVRVAVRLGEHVQIGASLQVLVLFALSQPSWDASNELDASVDGIGVMGGERLTGPVLVFFAPGVGARAQF